MSTNTTLSSITTEACAALVQHYSDPIHFAAADNEINNSHHQTTTNDDDDNAAPYLYFDTPTPGSSKPMLPNLPPVCGYWYKRLVEASSTAASSTAISSDDNVAATSDVARELICCYESTIHPLVKRCMHVHVSSKDSADNNGTDISENKVPLNATLEVLKHYGLLLAHIMKDASSSTAANSTMPVEAVGETTATTDENDCSNDSNIIEVSFGGNGWVGTKCETITSDSSIKPTTTKDLSSDVLGRMVHIIANDIFHWSTKLPTTRKKNNASLWKVQNILLPTLLRLIEHTVVILAAYRNNKPNNKSTTLLLSKETKEAMAIATIVAIPFVGDGSLNSGAFGIGSLLEWVESAKDNSASAADKSSLPSQLSLAHTLQECSPSPIISKGEGSNDATYLIPPSIMSSDFMTRSVIDWSVPAAYFDDAPWVSSISCI